MQNLKIQFCTIWTLFYIIMISYAEGRDNNQNSTTRKLNQFTASNFSSPRTYYFTPKGNGNQTGKEWNNAFSISELQDLLDVIEPGDKILLGSGTYEISKITFRNSGSYFKKCEFIGKDTGNGLPIIKGNWRKETPSIGEAGLFFDEDSSNWSIRNLIVTNFQLGIWFSRNGNHRSISLENIKISYVRDGLWLENLFSSTIKDVRIDHYTKKGMRFRKNCNNINIYNSLANCSGGDDSWYNYTEIFPMGFLLEQENCKNISFINCTAINNKKNGQTGYPNGDGFDTEEGSRNIKFINCIAFNNQDGGFDCKGDKIEFEGCISFRNYRNFRWWTGTAEYNNCISGYAINEGFWLAGNASINKSTIVGNHKIYSIWEETPFVKLDFTSNNLIYDNDETSLDTECDNCKFDNPKFVNPKETWRGDPTNSFNSLKYGKNWGYNYKAYSNQPCSQKQEIENIFLQDSDIKLQLGLSKKMIFSISPICSDAETISFTSTDPSILSIDSNGNMTGLKPGKAFIKIRVSNGKKVIEKKSKITVFQIGLATDYNVFFTERPIDLDGKIKESTWNLDFGIKKIGLGDKLARGRFGLLWDKSYLYIAVKIEDKRIFGDNSNSTFWNDDGIEVYIDGNGNKGEFYDKYDRQYVKNVVSKYFFNNGNKKGVKHAIAEIEDGYSAEFAIPWSNLALFPVQNLKFGLDIGINDDYNGGNRDSQLFWRGFSNNFKNTSKFGNVKLSLNQSRTDKLKETNFSSLENIVLFPNPSNGNNVRLQGLKPQSIIQISNISGKSLAILKNNNENYFSIPKEIISKSGIYLIEIQDASYSSKHLKLIVN